MTMIDLHDRVCIVIITPSGQNTHSPIMPIKHWNIMKTWNESTSKNKKQKSKTKQNKANII